MALVVKGTCRRLSEEERRGLGGLLKLISDKIIHYHHSCTYNDPVSITFDIFLSLLLTTTLYCKHSSYYHLSYHKQVSANLVQVLSEKHVE